MLRQKSKIIQSLIVAASRCSTPVRFQISLLAYNLNCIIGPFATFYAPYFLMDFKHFFNLCQVLIFSANQY